MDNPQIARFYTGVPETQRKQLQDFRNRFPYQTAEVNGMIWRYIDSGAGESALSPARVVFVFAGGTSIAETSFQTLDHLARHYRVIAPDYPPVGKLDTLFSGAIGLLDRLGVGQFSLMGGSYGGWMAQSFVRFCPDRIQKLVITAVGPPDPENSRQIEKMLPLLRLLPAALLRKMLLGTFKKLFKDENPNQSFLLAHLKEILYFRVQRADILTSMQRLVDQTKNTTFSPDDLKTWSGKILLLYGSEDPAATPEKRATIQALYPRAKMHIIQGADHTASVTHQEEYYRVIDTFLAE